MITTVTTFHLPEPVTSKEARAIFLSTAPKYQGVPGLVRKQYLFGEDRRTVGGVYLWKTRADAEAMYTDDWRAFVRGKYGCDPTVVYYETPVVVDNEVGQVLS